MLIGARNWYTELGTLPVSVGADAGAAYGLAELAKPYRGAISRSAKAGASPPYRAGIEVTWPRAVPMRLVAMLGYLAPAFDAAQPSSSFRWTLRNGGSGGALVAQATASITMKIPPGAVERFPIHITADLGARYTGDYLIIEWNRTGAAGVPVDFTGLWASDAISVNADHLGIEMRNASIIETGLDGADVSIDGRMWRVATVAGDIDTAVMSASDTDDSIESFAELLAAAGNSSPVLLFRGAEAFHGGSNVWTIHGKLTSEAGIAHRSGPAHRVSATIEEL